MSPVAVGIVVMAAYFLGTFPTAALVARSEGRDANREGSGNPGASNVYRLAGARAGGLVLAGDVLKGVLAAIGGLALDGRALGVAAGIAATVGHCLPFNRWRGGGKGVATAGGMGTVLFPAPAFAALAVWGIVAAVTRKASLASVLAVAAMPAIAAAAGEPGRFVLALSAVAMLVVGRHAANIGRLMRGEERSLRADRTAG